MSTNTIEPANLTPAEFIRQWPDTYQQGMVEIGNLLKKYQKTFGLNEELKTVSFTTSEEYYQHGFYYLKYYYFPDDQSKNDKKRCEQLQHLRQLALEQAQACFRYYVDSTTDAEPEKKAEAAFQLAWLYFYHPVLRYKEENHRLARQYLETAVENGHPRAKRFARQRLVARLSAHVLMFSIYSALIAGAVLLAMASALAWPITVAIGVGSAITCAAHWFGFRHYHKLHNSLKAKIGDSKLAKALGIFQENYVAQGSPSAQLRDVILYGTGVADVVEAKRAGRYAQLPKGVLGGVFFWTAMVYFFPAVLTAPWLLLAGAIVVTVAVGVASGDTNRRVFTWDLSKLAARNASPEAALEDTSQRTHKIQRNIAFYSNLIYGACMGLTVFLVSMGALLSLASVIASGPLFIPALLLMTPIFAITTYASYVVGRGYFTLSYLCWIENIEKKWRNWNLNKPLDPKSKEPVGLLEKIFGVIGYVIATCVALSLTLLSIMELKIVFSFIPGLNNWLYAGGTLGVAGSPGNAVLYFTSIITTFRKMGQAISHMISHIGKGHSHLADTPLAIGSIFFNIKKGLTLGLNASGNAFISAVPTINLLAGSIIAGFVLPSIFIPPVAITVAALAGIASLSVCYINWAKEMDKRDTDKTLAEQAYDRSLINSFNDAIIGAVAFPFTLAAVVVKGAVISIAKMGRWVSGLFVKENIQNSNLDVPASSVKDSQESSNHTIQNLPVFSNPGGLFPRRKSLSSDTRSQTHQLNTNGDDSAASQRRATAVF